MASAREAKPVLLECSEGGSSLDKWDVDELGSDLGGHAQAIYSIEQGNPGLRLLTQWAVTTSCLNSTMVCAGFPRTNSGVLHCVALGVLPYFIAICQVVFAVTAWVFEVELACVQRFGAIDAFQDLLLDQTPWLADVGVRGVSYFVQGLLWLLFASAEEPHHIVIGLWLAVVAMFDVCVHFNVLPRRILAKPRQLHVETHVGLEEVPRPVHVIGLTSSSLQPGDSQPEEELRAGRASSKQSGVRQAELRAITVVENHMETGSRQASKTSRHSSGPPAGLKATSPRGATSPEGDTSPPGQRPQPVSPGSGTSAQKALPAVQGKQEKSCCEVM